MRRGQIVLTSKVHLQGEPELGTVAWEKKIQFKTLTILRIYAFKATTFARKLAESVSHGNLCDMRYSLSVSMLLCVCECECLCVCVCVYVSMLL